MQILRTSAKSKNYPEKLSSLSSPPEKLNIAGDLEKLLEMPTIGIVGSRKVSSYGRGVTENLAGTLARAGIGIISGLALGVDSIAHISALNSGGKTIAVLPSGIKNIYPSSHRELAKKIIKTGGALVSEYEDSFRPRRESFIQRNRIIAGLADVLLVTEAAEKSGSLYTANFALEMGKTVFAVPGNINSPTSRGTNNLIKTGAIMVTDEQDIFAAMNISQKYTQTEIYGDNEYESAVLKLIKNGTTSGDELYELSNLDVQIFQQTLTMLEIKGSISPLGNNHWRLK